MAGGGRDGQCRAIQYLLYIGVPLTNTAATSSSRNPSQFLRTSPEAHQPGRTGAGSRGTAELQGPNEITHLCKKQQAKESCHKTIVKQKRRSKLIDAVRNCLQNRAGQRQGKRLMRSILARFLEAATFPKLNIVKLVYNGRWNMDVTCNTSCGTMAAGTEMPFMVQDCTYTPPQPAETSTVNECELGATLPPLSTSKEISTRCRNKEKKRNKH